MSVQLQTGVLKKVANDNFNEPITIKVSGLARNSTNRLIGTAWDGENSVPCHFGTRYGTMYDEKKLSSNDVVKATSYQATTMNGDTKLILLDLEVLGKADGGKGQEDAAVPSPKRIRLSEENTDTAMNTPGPAPSPSEAMDALTPAGDEESPSSFTFHTPGSALLTPPLKTSPKAFAAAKPSDAPRSAPALKPAADRAVIPISALNPYQTRWTIKAKVEKIQEKRTINGKDGALSVLSCVIVDEQGIQIEGTFWGDYADKMYGTLKEGTVYYISNGAVSPSNRKFSTVNNDYKVTFKPHTSFEVANDQDASKMKASYHFVAVDCLASRIGKKLPVDIVGIVTAVSPLTSIKRTSDGTEITRRDVTIVDKSLRSVIVTLWREGAEQVGAKLEALKYPVLVMSKMRVTDFNGVSVNQAYSSTFEVDPTDVPEAQELRHWWTQEGSTQTFVPAGEGAMRKGGASRGAGDFAPISVIMPPADKIILPDDKPTYHTLRCTIANISEEQSLYYMANPENYRKVVEQNGKYWCEHDAKTYDTMQRRYVMNMQVADFTGQQHVNVFNDQAVQILGDAADVIGPLKESDTSTFAERLKAPRWGEWVLDIMAKPKEYNGNTRMRLNVRSARPVDYAADASRLIQAISASSAS